MRASVISTFALAVALAPAAVFAQQNPPAQPPAGQTPATQQPQTPAAPAAPKISFKTPAGMLLVQIHAGQESTFEEMMGKIKSGLAASDKPELKSQAASWHYYKAAEPAAGGNTMYVVMIDPAQPNTEYQFFEVLNKTLTEAQQRDPATADMYKKYNAAIASMNLLNLTPMSGGQ